MCSSAICWCFKVAAMTSLRMYDVNIVMALEQYTEAVASETRLRCDFVLRTINVMTADSQSGGRPILGLNPGRQRSYIRARCSPYPLPFRGRGIGTSFDWS